jgi:hypothetical protein
VSEFRFGLGELSEIVFQAVQVTPQATPIFPDSGIVRDRGDRRKAPSSLEYIDLSHLHTALTLLYSPNPRERLRKSDIRSAVRHAKERWRLTVALAENR